MNDDRIRELRDALRWIILHVAANMGHSRTAIRLEASCTLKKMTND